MSTVLMLAGVLLVLATVTTATGWALAVVGRIPALCGRRIEALIGNAFIGTGVWILVFSWCSYLGLSAREARGPLLGAMMSLVGLALRRARPRPGGAASRPALLFFISGALAVGLIFWPLASCACVWPFNDTLTYCWVSQHLQGSGFGTGTLEVNPDRPGTWYVHHFQFHQWRMGSTFLLSLVVGYSALDPLLAFPVVTAWGMLLNLGGIFLVARWSFRLGRWGAAGAALAAAAALNPLYTSAHQGFQPQLYGTAYLAFIVAVLARAGRHSFRTPANAILLALAAVTLVSVYSELAPLAALTAAGWFVLGVVRSRNERNVRGFVRFTSLTALLLILIGNYEWYRAWHAVRAAIGVAVGSPIPWADGEFWGFALGNLPFNHRTPIDAGRATLVSVSSILILIGAVRMARDRRAAVVGMALLTFALMTAYFRFVATDPFSGAVGHRWSLFKLCKWAYPLLLVVQFAGLAALLPRGRLRPVLFIAPGLLALTGSWAGHKEYNRWAARATSAFADSTRPLDEWDRLAAELDRVGEGPVYLIRRDGDRAPDVLLPYVLRDRPFVNGWRGCDLKDARAVDAGALPTGTIVLMYGVPPFERDGEPLPAGMTRLDAARPHLTHFESLSSGGATLTVWAPRQGPVRFRATGIADMVELRHMDGDRQHMALGRGGQLEAVFALPAGVSTLHLRGPSATPDDVRVEWVNDGP